MTRFDRGTLTCPRLVDYFIQAGRPRERWLVGLEVEKMGVSVRDGRSIPYPDVRRVLEAYHAHRGGIRVHEGEHLIGLDGDWGEISLEPGGQVEWSSRPAPDLDALDAALRAHLRVLDEVGAEVGVRWLDVGVQPEQPVETMPWMPKARYVLMRDYLGARGRLAHRMMTQTASVQCAFDYADEGDWTRKFRAAALLTPVAVALFGNSSRADGRDTGWRSWREAIWKEVDPARCGLPAIVFDPAFDLRAWVEWVLDVPAIFRRRSEGLVSAHGKPFRSYLERVGCDAVGIDDWELHLSSVFTEVRSYAYVEVRSADLQPDDLLLSVPALWTGVLYDDDALSAALELGRGHDDHAAWRAAMDSSARLGLEGTAGGVALRDLAAEVLGLALAALKGGARAAGASGVRALERLGERHALPLGRAIR
ncbi:MAG TPA: glutamate-cysteine ligase family protein [Candidatus Polarisedimenticolaceae bacterium]|nr:glutamate-cysteine ligase family protein [Candidatus Polarisedimenticolaceae bacterium]